MKKAILVALLAVTAAYVTLTAVGGAAPSRATAVPQSTLGAQGVHAEFLARKATLQAQWLAVRIARGRNLLAAHPSAPAALRDILNRNVTSLVTLRQTVVSTQRPIAGSFYAGVSRALFHSGTGTFHGFPRVASPPPPPTISALSPNQGQPSDVILINGSDFGSATGTVDFVLGPNAVGPGGTESVQQASAFYWSDTQIGVYVPNVSGLTAYSGFLYVQAATGQSNLVAFQFQPALDVQQLPIGTGNAQYGGTFCGSTPWPLTTDTVLSAGIASPVYCSNTFSGTHGDDWYFRGNTLTNGWTLDSVNFIASGCGNNAMNSANGAWVKSSGQGTTTPYVDVFWNDSPNLPSTHGWVCYTLGLTITGPLGTPW